uniref:Uncharacterized protein n=1 Tax=Anguilla anguilla TaxID=7936 RepID=A0A0E9QXK7_ANGAN
MVTHKYPQTFLCMVSQMLF